MQQDSRQVVKPQKKRFGGIMVILACIILAACMGLFGMSLYRYYMVTVTGLRADGCENWVTVYVDTDEDESLLYVVCTDVHGNEKTAAVEDGKATFTELASDTSYQLTVRTNGFHRPSGETETTYFTPAQTNIVQFSAVTGAEDGSVILSFTVGGPDSGQWSVAYSAEGEPEKVESLVTHTEQLENLTIGKEYTFTLIPGDDMYVVGTNQLKHTASKLVYANDLKILSCVEGNLTAAWSAPEDVQVAEWTVRCYNDSGYDQTIVTSETSVVFEGIDNTSSYNLDVTAAGMSVSKSVHLTENAITVSEFTADTSNSNRISLKWSASPNAPENGWILMYSIAGSDYLVNMPVNSNSATISPAIPGATYIFTLQDADGADVLCPPLVCQTPEVSRFAGYGVTARDISMKMCRVPDAGVWSAEDLTESDYTTHFASGERVGFVGQLLAPYAISDDRICELYVIRDGQGSVLQYCTVERPWRNMWYQSNGEFEMLQVPSQPGEYYVSVYFNGALVTEQHFTIE